MEVINPHSLFNDKVKKININGTIKELLETWKKMIEEKCPNEKIDVDDAFVAGYFIGKNYQLKEKYKDKHDSEVEKYISPYYTGKEIKSNKY